MNKVLFIFCFLFLIASCGSDNGQGNNASSSNEVDTSVVQTARQAYIFSVPLALMDITRRKMTDGKNKDAAAINTFAHKSAFPDADFRDVVRPNADTYYSTATLDLSQGALVLSVPDTKGRYYMMPMLDAYTNVFASPGSRTTGTKAGNFLITGPGWTGTVPANMPQLKSPTSLVWIIGRTQVNSKEDGNKIVVPIQHQYKLTPLNEWGKAYTPPGPMPDNNLSKLNPNEIVKTMPIDEFFNYTNNLMIKNPPAEADKPVMEKFALLGIKPGGKFALDSFNAATQEALKKIPAEFFASASSFFAKPKELVNGWVPMHNTGAYGTDYQSRALVAYGGLGANLPEDAIYPSAAFDESGNALNGANNYVIHFAKGETPPANAFWSLTMYDPEGFMIKNPINRNAIGDRSNLKTNADGSTDIFIQHNSPGKDKESNWLPAPEGAFNVLMRVYWPKQEILSGAWKAPGIMKAK
ncbi:DUF1254 domain-containing protein [Danxiaibacter flavus]|uniref:DUF1254 domain-containing protein n=1 Tax=Danxiaibacter flavus TaxID=3049108 RepID=A0ABV3ZD84_9BACT|nr:DUF1254 domain-containing protein [Chitinophagaceae bacterium DXS]